MARLSRRRSASAACAKGEAARGSSSPIEAGLTTEPEPARGVYGAVELQAAVLPLSKPSAKSAPGTTSVRQALRPWVKA